MKYNKKVSLFQKSELYNEEKKKIVKSLETRKRRVRYFLKI